MVILGGMGSTVGVFFAAIILTILPELLRDVQEYRMIVYSLLLVIMMLVRPQGLFGVKLGKKKKKKLKK
jgi:branched-chain amino acid transport system permease protein